MTESQAGILAPVPLHGRHLFFDIDRVEALPEALQRLRELADGDNVVAGFGLSLVNALGHPIDGLHVFPALSGKGFSVPSTPAALWCWLRNDDPGVLVLKGMELETALAPAFSLQLAIDVFRYDRGLDLTGYEDGTENPVDDEAFEAAITQGKGPGLDGGSFVAIQQWRHDLKYFSSLSQAKQDDIIGRRKSDNEEFEEAPESAHVKRAAQESYTPEAFVVRRSMPWSDARRAGLVFVAFGKSLDAFESILQRMTGAEDGITDAMFSFTRPLTGAYFWCPPMKGKKLDLSAIGLS